MVQLLLNPVRAAVGQSDQDKLIQVSEPRPGVDVPTVRCAFDLADGLVPVYERAHSFHGPAAVLSDGSSGSGETEQRDVELETSLEQLGCPVPRPVWGFGMNDADGAVPRLDGDCERHLGERIAPSAVRPRIDAPQPAVGPFGRAFELVLKPCQCRVFVIASRDGFESVLQPLDGVAGVWPARDEVAYSEQPIAPGVEGEGAERVLERTEASVDVADDEVAPLIIVFERGAERFHA